ncbi:MAG: UDP-glucose 4-epimerase GalE [Pseudomonadota bacterium]|uniref:UDP-glucose 4-epimerase n=1 Tax=Candidatus Desulfatibia profunda TaxID=2841695 RepID=A0A8J6NXP7_9BACT|nr:UDP-glucose 4-epimerase GalE [Candidatus Desulfatibia profunda]MBL7179275.1 UDP-glucose 4-epimerase GalE [Desulfobacterales bacterium]MBU0698987.1 UDP-glucose 4-epimerase GalE [Pseudomonadota bacterium]
MKTVLVTGGAGYIGSHMVKELHRKNYNTIVLDNLDYGHREAVNTGIFIQGDLGNKGLMETIFKTHPIDAVMHFSAYAYVGESVLNPRKYYQNNVANTLNLLDAMLNFNVKKFIFSSSCATYGEPIHIPITEDHPQKPINPYGYTKFMVEQILRDYSTAYHLHYVSLRYFNAAGADPDGEIGEDHDPETHLIPLTLRAAAEASGLKKTKSGEPVVLKVFGNDYQTKDGTCIRDYIHVVDLASAHILALERMMAGGKSDVFNLGNGEGYSVKEVIDTASEVSGIDIPFEYVDRRQGDPAALVGSSAKAKEKLGWKPRYATLSQIVETAWNWHKKHPEGFKSRKTY